MRGETSEGWVGERVTWWGAREVGTVITVTQSTRRTKGMKTYNCVLKIKNVFHMSYFMIKPSVWAGPHLKEGIEKSQP